MRREAPAAGRNRQPILDVLRTCLPGTGLVLEVASGTGEHAVHFAMALRSLDFQPSDPDPDQQASIDDWTRTLALTNVRPALELDAAAETWPVERADAVVCINMIHIAPWAAAVGLMRGAARILAAGGVLFLYGPYHRGGRPTSPGNETFDRSLRQRDPAWGIRDLEEITSLADREGFAHERVVDMPANNLSLVFRRR
jgi:SAM-dependent methyltransferase